MVTTTKQEIYLAMRLHGSTEHLAVKSTGYLRDVRNVVSATLL